MAMERTFSIIKPDAVAGNHVGAIIDRFEKAGLCVAAAKLTRLDRNKAELFYAEHKERPFFKALVDYMISGPCLLMCLAGEGAVLKNRELMGATDPQKAAPGTIRRDFAKSIDANAVHGSDSPESAKRELAIFFSETEIVNAKM